MPKRDQSSKTFREVYQTVFQIAPAILKQASKCRHDFSCLQTGRCGDNPMCVVETAHGENVLCVSGADWPQCSYHLDFGGARFCVCPVRSAIHRQQSA
jgi:hypothetical protein